MGNPKYLLVVFFPLALSAQNTIPLKNWVTPLYWRPTQTGRGAGARTTPATALPQIQFSANQVSTDALTFVAITPCRLVDTRGTVAGFNGISPFSGPSVPAVGMITIPVQSADEAGMNTTPAPCGVIPSIAEAYSFNVTVVPQGGAVDYISLWPSGGAQPFVSTLDDPQGAIVSNAAIVPAGMPGGGISVFNAGPAAMDVIIDMNGYYAPPTDENSNTAVGVASLASDTTGFFNTASGAAALFSNTTGDNNTATGYQSLAGNTSGFFNTATGGDALSSNTTGNNNTATGTTALQNNTTGSQNTASGAFSLLNNTTGSVNSAEGFGALYGNTTGSLNAADGYDALVSNTTGNNNTASGANALGSNTTGSGNIAIGYQAALSVAPGNGNNIHIGSQGVSTDIGVIRIGDPASQNSFFAAGVSGVTTGLSGAVPVVIDTNGQLGTMSSSARFKEDVQDMGDASSALLRLRPVTFRYKQPYADGSKPIDYGLIAEEVAQVYPDLAVKDTHGQIQTVQYQKLTPMLLNEVQKQAEQNRHQEDQIRQQTEQIRSLQERLAVLEALLSTIMPAVPDPAR